MCVCCEGKLWTADERLRTDTGEKAMMNILLNLANSMAVFLMGISALLDRVGCEREGGGEGQAGRVRERESEPPLDPSSPSN